MVNFARSTRDTARSTVAWLSFPSLTSSGTCSKLYCPPPISTSLPAGSVLVTTHSWSKGSLPQTSKALTRRALAPASDYRGQLSPISLLMRNIQLCNTHTPIHREGFPPECDDLRQPECHHRSCRIP